MLKHKSLHKSGLDYKLYLNTKNINCKKDYYLYIWDVCTIKTNNVYNFFDIECNKYNTWNYLLNLDNVNKDEIMRISPIFGFGDYNIVNYNLNKYIVKAKSHIFSEEKYGQAQIINKENIKNIDKNKYVIQPILNNKNGEEINIFILRDLDTRDLYLECIIIKHNTKNNINRKKNKIEKKIVDINNVLSDNEINNLIKYCNHINLDYARLELIRDEKLGLCIIDINNSPGGGPLTKFISNRLSEILINIMQNKITTE